MNVDPRLREKALELLRRVFVEERVAGMPDAEVKHIAVIAAWLGCMPGSKLFPDFPRDELMAAATELCPGGSFRLVSETAAIENGIGLDFGTQITGLGWEPFDLTCMELTEELKQLCRLALDPSSGPSDIPVDALPRACWESFSHNLERVAPTP